MVINSPYAGIAIARQKKKQAFLLFDDEANKYMETVGFDRGAQNVGGVAGDKLANLEGQIKSATEMALYQREPGRIRRGAEQAAMSEFTSRTKGNILSREVTLVHRPPRGNKEEGNCPLIPKGMIKAPSEDVKTILNELL